MTIAKHAAIKASKFAGVPKSLQKSVAETKVEYRRLGRSGLRVSNPILGGLQIGSPDWLPWVLGEDEVLPWLLAAYVTYYSVDGH